MMPSSSPSSNNNSSSSSLPSQSSTTFPVHFVYKGKTITLDNKITALTTCNELYRIALQHVLQIDNNDDKNNESASTTQQLIKLLYKGKRLDSSSSSDEPVFSSTRSTSKPPKIIVMATSSEVVQELATKRSDPLIRNFQQEEERKKKQDGGGRQQHWGQLVSANHSNTLMLGQQDPTYNFRKLVPCTWQSFGWRSTSDTPHVFEAMRLLEKLVTDPGVVRVIRERQLVVLTLGEMDPIDDRIKQKHEHGNKGSCLLGYNTNNGLRIDIKLRTDNLSNFLPYNQLVTTLLHELSHNWVGEHNLLFWTNYAHMRCEYLYEHKKLLNHEVRRVGGTSSSSTTTTTTTAEIAGLDQSMLNDNNTIYECIMKELIKEMRQHGLHPNLIAESIQQHCEEIQLQQEEERRRKQQQGGHKLGSNTTNTSGGGVEMDNKDHSSKRQRALEAAEERAREQQQQQQQQQQRRQQQQQQENKTKESSS